MAKSSSSFTCTACGAAHGKWAGRCEACGAWNTIVEEAPLAAGPGVEDAGRDARPGDRAQRPRHRRAAAAAHRLRDGRVRPRARRRAGAGLGDPGRRRSRDRQVDAAAAGRRIFRPQRTEVHLYFRRGGGGASADARRPAGPAGRAGAAGGRDQPARHPDHARHRAPRPRGDRFDPDDVGRQRRKRARLGQPGPRRRVTSL